MRINKESKVIWSHFQIANNCIFLTGTGAAFMIGYLSQIGFSKVQIGIYGAIIGFAGFFNIIGSWVAQKSGNFKKVYLGIFTIAIFFCLVGVAVSYLTYPTSNKTIQAVVLFLMMIWQVFTFMSIPALLSWLHSIAGNKGWGKFFSTRMIVGDVTGFITSFAVGSYLGENPKNSGFLVVFLIAIMFGFLGNFFMSKFPNAVLNDQSINLKKYIGIIKNILKQKRFKYLLWVVFSRAFAYSIIMPFQPIFLLEELKIDYTKIALMINLSIAFSIAAYKMWARLQIKYGNYIGLKWSVFLSLFVPFLWIFASQNNLLSIYIAFILVGLAGNYGIAGAGFFTSCIGIIFELSDDNYKPVYTSLYFLVTGIASSISPLIGGWLVKHFNAIPLNIALFNLELNGYSIIFAVSGMVLVLPIVFIHSLKKVFVK